MLPKLAVRVVWNNCSREKRAATDRGPKRTSTKQASKQAWEHQTDESAPQAFRQTKECLGEAPRWPPPTGAALAHVADAIAPPSKQRQASEGMT